MTDHAAGPQAPEDTTVKTDDTAKEAQDSLIAIQKVISRYVDQLLYGCGDPQCRNQVCDSGRRNTSGRPIRRYTPRSARLIAITLASGPRPRSRLCRKRAHTPEDTEAQPEGPRDPGADLQLLADTASIRKICSRTSKLGEEDMVQPSLLNECRTWHATLDNVAAASQRAFQASRPGPFMTDDATRTCFHDCIAFLLNTLPKGGKMQWEHVNKIISAGNAYPSQNSDTPSDPSFNTWLNILDGLEQPQAFRLFCRVLEEIGKCGEMERYAATNGGRFLWAMSSHETDERRLLPRLAKDPVSDSVLRGGWFGLIVWLKKAFLRHWDGAVVLERGKIPHVCLSFIRWMVIASGQAVDDEALCNDLVSMPVVVGRCKTFEMARAWLDGSREGHLLSFPFLFTLDQRATYFRAMNYRTMADTVDDVRRIVELRARLTEPVPTPPGSVIRNRLKYLTEQYLLLSINRGTVLKDAFDQLWQRRRGELVRPLRVRLGEMETFEVGHDLGGVQIEFFNLICRAVLDESANMFTTDPATGYSYFRPCSLQPLHMFEIVGLLFALALYNGITLPVNFPLAFYLVITGNSLRFPEAMAEGWPATTRSLNSLLEQDVPGLERTFPLEANGLRMTVQYSMEYCMMTPPGSPNTLAVVDATPIIHYPSELDTTPTSNENPSDSPAPSPPTVDIASIATSWPGWHLTHTQTDPDEITPENKHVHAEDYTHWLTYGSVQPQWTAFLQGWHTIFPPSSSPHSSRPTNPALSLLTPTHLRNLLEGTPKLSIPTLRHITQYEGFAPTERYIHNFWRIVTSWPVNRQRALLKFVTACERLPAGGAGNLTFIIKKGPASAAAEGLLPTSSTCFGTLTLPRYQDSKVLERKLALALKFGLEGFGSA